MEPFEEFAAAIREEEEKDQRAAACFQGMFTTPYVAPGTVKKTLGLVSATIVRAAGMLAQFRIDMKDAFGGRSGAAEHIIDTMRHQALTVLRQRCLAAGGNAVTNVTINFGEFGSNVFMATAEGTAVVVVPDRSV